MAKDSTDPPRRPQPLHDTRKILKAFEQSPIWREQQAKLAEIRKATLEPESAPEPITTPEPANESVSEPVTDPTTPATQAPPIKRKPPKQWAADWMKAHPKGENEAPGEYAKRMCDDMANAQDVTEPWPFKTCQRELYRKPSEADFEPDPDSVQDYPKHH